MAKSCLVDYRGFITDIRDVGDEFEVYQGPDSHIRWVICDDDNVDNTWVLYNGEFFSGDLRLERNQDMKRKVAYGSIEEQLDMMYWDQVNGTTTWKDHIASITRATRFSVPKAAVYFCKPICARSDLSILRAQSC